MAHLGPTDYEHIVTLEEDHVSKASLKTPIHLRQHIDVFNVGAHVKGQTPDSLPELSDGESVTTNFRTRGSVDSNLSEPLLDTSVQPEGLLLFSNQPSSKLDKVSHH